MIFNKLLIMLKLNILVNPWLNDINKYDDAEYLNKLLNLGYQVSTLSQISINPECSLVKPIEHEVKQLSETIINRESLFKDELGRHSDDIKQQYNNLEGIICKLTGNLATSATKGKIGENFIEAVIKDNFPDDQLSVTAQTGHEADMQLSSNGKPTILIESKMYKSSVSTKEIVKFYNDLESTGTNYGIFVSLTSSICKHKRLEYERKDGKHVVFLPNTGFNSIGIIYGILFLRQISANGDMLDNVSASLIEEKCRVIYDSLDNLNMIHENLNKLKSGISKSKMVIDEQLNNLSSTIINAEIVTKNIIQDMRKSIYNSLNDLNDNFKPILENEFEKIINEFMQSDNKLYINFGKSLNICKGLDLNISKEENKHKYILTKDDLVIMEVKIGKAKCVYDIIGKGIKYDIKADTNLDIFERIIGNIL